MNHGSSKNFQPELRHNSEQKADNQQVSPSIANANVIGGFVKGEKVVWDSHFGYEIGYFLGEGVVFNSYMVDVRTGIITGDCSYSQNEVYKYTNELIDCLTKKYGYEKRFSDIF